MHGLNTSQIKLDRSTFPSFWLVIRWLHNANARRTNVSRLDWHSRVHKSAGIFGEIKNRSRDSYFRNGLAVIAEISTNYL